MPNGDPTTGQSKAPYIILCGGRIDALAAQNDPAKVIAAASTAAVRLTTFYDLKGWLTLEDSEPISELQHSMMTLLQQGKLKPAEATRMAGDMFTLLSNLEKRYEQQRAETES